VDHVRAAFVSDFQEENPSGVGKRMNDERSLRLTKQVVKKSTAAASD
jgi:hypothetical protein